MEITKDKLEDYADHLRDGFTLIVVCDGNFYTITSAESYVGFEDLEDHYVSDVMGNTPYADEYKVITDTISHLIADGSVIERIDLN